MRGRLLLLKCHRKALIEGFHAFQVGQGVQPPPAALPSACEFSTSKFEDICSLDPPFAPSPFPIIFTSILYYET